MTYIFQRLKNTHQTFICAMFGLLLISTSWLAQAQGTTETITFFHHDASGSVVAATNEAGEEIWRKNYTPYGEQQTGSNQTETVSYTGHIHDKNLGLTYMKARYYDPQAGRFMGTDPVGVLESVEANPQMFNRYAYANNNPFSFTDPDGRAPKGRGDGGGASAAGALIGCMIGNCNPRLSRTIAATAAKDGNYNIAGSIALNGGMSSKDFVSMVDKVQGKKGNKKAPKPNNGNARPHGNRNHNNAIDNRIADLKQDPSVTNIRKNQQQVDVNGIKVGTNRPDIQFDKKGCHHCVEFDNVPRNSARHGKQIKANDPNAKTELNLL